MIFDIDITDLIKKILKKQFRKERWIGFLSSILKPVKDINESFVEISDDIHYRMLFNAQTIYLEHYLNDQYDNVLRAIWIENTGNTNQVYIFNEDEGQLPPYIFNEAEAEYLSEPVYLFNQSEPLSSEDFIVWVPSYVVWDETLMRSQIDQYRYAGKIYSIQVF